MIDFFGDIVRIKKKIKYVSSIKITFFKFCLIKLFGKKNKENDEYINMTFRIYIRKRFFELERIDNMEHINLNIFLKKGYFYIQDSMYGDEGHYIYYRFDVRDRYLDDFCNLIVNSKKINPNYKSVKVDTIFNFSKTFDTIPAIDYGWWYSGIGYIKNNTRIPAILPDEAIMNERLYYRKRDKELSRFELDQRRDTIYRDFYIYNDEGIFLFAREKIHIYKPVKKELFMYYNYYMKFYGNYIKSFFSFFILYYVFFIV